MRKVQVESQGRKASSAIIPFPGAADRPHRIGLAADEPKGKLLLFTGVRYERTETDIVPTPPFASNGTRRRRS